MRRNLLRMVVLIALLVSLSPFTALGQEDNVGAPPQADDGGFFSAGVDVFRRQISPIDGDRCPMYPSCSRYSLDAVDKHGLLMGWIMTCDRLLRCGRDELSLSPPVIVDDERRCYDPVKDNDFWRNP